MTDEIKSLIKETKDLEYIREVATVKRALELWTMDKTFREKFSASPKDALAEYGLDVDAQAVKIIADLDEALKYKDAPAEKIPRATRRYRAFMEEKKSDRDHMTQVECAPELPAFRAWRNRQKNRCWLELGYRNHSIIHAPMTFELDLGCSVGCPFCGIAAPKLSKVCRYAGDVPELWRGMLVFLKETVGQAAGSGTCYYATEPFDNPDYEKFSADFFDVFGIVPQVTTAAAMRKPERTKKFLADSLKQYRRVHRFSVLSADILKKIHEYFTPEELLLVELLPQFADAPECHLTKAGRSFGKDGKQFIANEDGATISCITGFVVNIAERSIRLITPCGADEKYPTGEIIIDKKFFTTLDDFKKIFSELVAKYMQKDFPTTQPLYLRDTLTYEETEEGIEFSRSGLMKFKFSGQDDLSPEFYHEILRSLRDGGKSAREIATDLMERKDFEPAKVFFVLKKFERAGLFLEPYQYAL